MSVFGVLNLQGNYFYFQLIKLNVVMPKSTLKILDAIKENLLVIEQQLLQHELRCIQRFPSIQAAHNLSASNLLHYLSLRSIDSRKLQAVVERIGNGYSKRQMMKPFSILSKTKFPSNCLLYNQGWQMPVAHAYAHR